MTPTLEVTVTVAQGQHRMGGMAGNLVTLQSGLLGVSRAAGTWEPPQADSSESPLLPAAVSQTEETLSVLFSCVQKRKLHRNPPEEQTMEADFQVCQNW